MAETAAAVALPVAPAAAFGLQIAGSNAHFWPRVALHP